ncbi:meiosis-specific nuclear structural protein 1-like isoform X1 [Periplaneta americana]|uniref:meiosis-specific nuclear structural protein 1-like isoform X1 n=1 Tax=Periplaneta americana TaxID=6978 RepID=UPI0037E8B23C
MRRTLHLSVLVGTVVSLILLSHTPGSNGAVIVHSSSSSSETSCNGLLCPPGSNCIAFTTNNNGNKTSDKRCTDFEGKVIRQETITIVDGKMCIKNVRMVNGIKEVERTCRNLRKTNGGTMENGDAIVPAFLDQDLLEDAIQNQERYTEWWNEKLDRNVDERIEALERKQEDRELLEETRRDLYERLSEARDEALDRQADALQEKLERQAEASEALLELRQEAKVAKLERDKEVMEKKAELYEQRMEREEEERQEKLDKTLDALALVTEARKYKLTDFTSFENYLHLFQQQ